MQGSLEFLTETPQRRGASIFVVVSVMVHSAILLFLALRRPETTSAPAQPIPRFVQLLRQQPPTFEEAPGPARESARLDAPYSNANRRASTPRPSGEKPTLRPGDGESMYRPPDPRGASGSASSPAAEPQQTQASQPESPMRPPDNSRREENRSANAAASEGINWKSAIQEIGKVASLGGEGLDPGSLGGDAGFAESGPISFESQWFEWGDYAEGMVRRIRVNWYANMPAIIRMGVKGFVVYRFTIQRNGTITGITLLKSSDVPPFDFAARKALELSSPLAPLPADFPNATERVTAAFYYNLDPPKK